MLNHDAVTRSTIAYSDGPPKVKYCTKWCNSFVTPVGSDGVLAHLLVTEKGRRIQLVESSRVDHSID